VEAISFLTSEGKNDLGVIENGFGKPIPRVTLPDFDYKAPPPPTVREDPGRVTPGIPGAGAEGLLCAGSLGIGKPANRQPSQVHSTDSSS